MSSPKVRIIFLSPHDVNDIGAWSGTAYSAFRALLRAGASVTFIRANWTDAILRNIRRLLRKIGVQTDYTASLIYARLAGVEVSARLLLIQGDVIFAMTASTYLYAIKTSRPVIFMSDATFASLSKLYSDIAAMPRWLKSDADRIERGALARSDRVIFSSEWARKSAIEDYGVSPDSVSVVPLGPNICSELIDTFKTIKTANFSGGVRLLFIGADWIRKGGPIFLDIRRYLGSRQIPCELFIVGNCPADTPAESNVHLIGRLDKTDNSQLVALCNLLELVHFFVLPTSADAYGIVFSEAQAFGCPSLTYAVGGTPSAVLDGITGYTLPPGASANEFGEKICSLMGNPRLYERMSRNCRRRYESEANWQTWGRAVVNVAADLQGRAIK